MRFRRWIAAVVGFAVWLPAVAQTERGALDAPAQPRLILIVVVDQFRQDYTTRFRSEFTGGLKTLLTQGAVFSDAHQDHYPTVTAPGHTAILTGAVPATSGIISNEWYDRSSGKVITSVEDANTSVPGDPAARGASPHNLIVSTVADQLKVANGDASRVIGISMKDRAAILTVGRMADAAYWFDPGIGGFVTSSWYRPAVPDWLQKFNERKLPQQSAGEFWTSSLHPGSAPFLQLPTANERNFFASWSGTPFSNVVLEELAETILDKEDLGRHRGPDVLSVSFSANDVLGHRVGPDAPEVEDMAIQTDKVIGKLLGHAAQRAGGLKNLLVVFTADHGVAPLPEVNVKRKLPGARVDHSQMMARIREKLSAKFGDGDWIQSDQGDMLYLNTGLIAQRGLTREAVEDETARLAMEDPRVARVYTRTQFLQHSSMQPIVDEYMARGFFAPRSGEVFILLQPYSVGAGAGASHGTPYDYDSHVPLIFYGWRIRPANYTTRTGISDVAPTLSEILSVETPSGSIGHAIEAITSK